MKRAYLVIRGKWPSEYPIDCEYWMGAIITRYKELAMPFRTKFFAGRTAKKLEAKWPERLGEYSKDDHWRVVEIDLDNPRP